MKKIEAYILEFTFTYQEEETAYQLYPPHPNVTIPLPKRLWDEIDNYEKTYFMIGFGAIREMTVKGNTLGIVYFREKTT